MPTLPTYALAGVNAAAGLVRVFSAMGSAHVCPWAGTAGITRNGFGA